MTPETSHFSPESALSNGVLTSLDECLSLRDRQGGLGQARVEGVVFPDGWLPDLAGGVFVRCRFAGGTSLGGDMAGAEFVDCALTGMTLTRVQFFGARFFSCDFSDSRLVDCDFSAASLNGCALAKAAFLRCDFDAAELEGCDLKLDDLMRRPHSQIAA